MVVRQLISLPSQLQLIDRLQHHIYLSSSLIFLSSQQGAGKSTLLELLTNQLPRNTQQAFIKLNGQQSDDQIRQQILLQFYENPLFDAHDSLLSSFSLLQEKHSNDTPRVIVFDNADHLSQEMLSELATLIAQKMYLGENEFNVLLLADDPNSRQMFAATQQRCACLEFKLEPLNIEESELLLNHLFKQVAYQHRIQHQDAVSKKLIACQGNPGKIIVLAEKIIAGELANNELSWLKTRLPAVLLMVLLVLIAAGLVSYLYPLFVKPTSSVVAVAQKVQSQTRSLEAQKTPATIKTALPAEQKSGPVMVEELAGSWQETLRAEVDENQLQVGIKDPVAQEIPKPDVFPDTTSISLEENVPSASPEPAISEAVPESLDEQQDKISEKIAIKEPALVQQTVPEIVTPLPEDPQADSIFTPDAQLLAIAATHYTLQLSAMETQESLRLFIVTHGSAQGDLHIYQTVHNNKPRYVVIFGEYDSWQSAKKASKALPGSLANLDSWIKKYQLVHRDLQLNNE